MEKEIKRIKDELIKGKTENALLMLNEYSQEKNLPELENFTISTSANLATLENAYLHNTLPYNEYSINKSQITQRIIVALGAVKKIGNREIEIDKTPSQKVEPITNQQKLSKEIIPLKQNSKDLEENINVYNQKLTVEGIIVDSNGNEPLIGASILIKGTSTGTVSNIDGSFNLEFQTNKSITLQVSYVGFKTLEQKIDLSPNKEKVRLALEANPFSASHKLYYSKRFRKIRRFFGDFFFELKWNLSNLKDSPKGCLLIFGGFLISYLFLEYHYISTFSLFK